MRGGCSESPGEGRAAPPSGPDGSCPGNLDEHQRPVEETKERPMASPEPAYERLGAKLLSLPDVVAQSVGFMGPVFSSAFVIPLVVGVISASGKGGGVASPLSVLIAAVGVFLPGWVRATYAKALPAARSLYPSPTPRPG